jgi:hypothetical protein
MTYFLVATRFQEEFWVLGWKLYYFYVKVQTIRHVYFKNAFHEKKASYTLKVLYTFTVTNNIS